MTTETKPKRVYTKTPDYKKQVEVLRSSCEFAATIVGEMATDSEFNKGQLAAFKAMLVLLNGEAK